MAAKKSEAVKVELLAKTIGHKRGDIIEVSPEIANSLIANRNARGIDDAAKALQAEIFGTAPDPQD